MRDKMREDFEVYAASKGWAAHQMERRADGGYEDWGVHPIWLAFQACGASMVAEVAHLKAENESLRGSCKAMGKDMAKVTRERNSAKAQEGRLKAESEALRKIISESATACGAAVSVECSLEFMQHLPAEIASVVGGLRKDTERYRWLRSRDLDAIQAGGLFAGMTPQNLVINLETLDDAIDAAMSKEIQP